MILYQTSFIRILIINLLLHDMFIWQNFHVFLPFIFAALLDQVKLDYALILCNMAIISWTVSEAYVHFLLIVFEKKKSHLVRGAQPESSSGWTRLAGPF